MTADVTSSMRGLARLEPWWDAELWSNFENNSWALVSDASERLPHASDISRTCTAKQSSGVRSSRMDRGAAVDRG